MRSERDIKELDSDYKSLTKDQRLRSPKRYTFNGKFEIKPFTRYKR
jgi:hypothetical protein